MKTTLNQKINSLEELNQIGDNLPFSNKILRTKLIAEKYFNSKFHKKGKFWIEKTANQVILHCAYKHLNGKPCYAPMIGFNLNN